MCLLEIETRVKTSDAPKWKLSSDFRHRMLEVFCTSVYIMALHWRWHCCAVTLICLDFSMWITQRRCTCLVNFKCYLISVNIIRWYLNSILVHTALVNITVSVTCSSTMFSTDIKQSNGILVIKSAMIKHFCASLEKTAKPVNLTLPNLLMCV